MKFLTLAVLCAMLAIASPSHGATFQLSFTASNFLPNMGSTPAPADPVAGTFTFEADSLGADISSLDSISLTIANHVYGLNEVGFQNVLAPGSPDSYIFGALINGVAALGGGTDDFAFGIIGASNYHDTLLAYTVAGNQSTDWFIYNYGDKPASDLLVSIVQLPEPSEYLLVLLGLSAIYVARSRWLRSAIASTIVVRRDLSTNALD